MPTLACGVVTDGLHVRAYGSVSFLVVQRFVLICCVYRVFGRVSSFVSVFFVKTELLRLRSFILLSFEKIRSRIQT